MMKVLYCESGSGRGGSATSLVQLLAAFKGTTITPEVACFTKDACTLFEPLGVPVHHLSGRNLAASMMTLWQIIGAAKIDLVHTNNDIYSHIATILGSRTRNVPIVTHHRAVRRLTRMERMLWRRIKRHIAVSEYVRHNLTEQGIAADAIDRVYDAIAMPDPDRLDRNVARRTLELDRSVRLVGTVGSLRPEKGLGVLVEAAERLRHREEIRFVVIGSEYHRAPGYEQELRTLVAEKGLESRFYFTGHLDNPIDWISSLDLVAFPTLLPEGFGRASLEAMVCRVPVVASAIGAIPEVVHDGSTGFLVRPGDPDALAATIEQALDSNLSGMVAFAQQTAATRFNVHEQVSRVVKIYHAVLGEPGSP